MAMIASTFSSSPQATTALVNFFGVASPNTSIGFFLHACLGRISSKISYVALLNWASCPPLATSMSVAITAGPPAFVIIAKFSPFGNGWQEKA